MVVTDEMQLALAVRETTLFGLQQMGAVLDPVLFNHATALCTCCVSQRHLLLICSVLQRGCFKLLLLLRIYRMRRNIERPTDSRRKTVQARSHSPGKDISRGETKMCTTR